MKVKIKGYQAIKDAELEFDKGITVIVGKTNSGKSSIIRAIESAINNKSGNSFINYDSSESVVKIVTDNNDHIIWTKPKRGTASYSVNGEVFSKIGRTQDDDIAALLNMPEIAVGSNKIRLNFWKQLEYPFLVGYTSGQLFEFISKSPEQGYMKHLQDTYDSSISGLKKSVDSYNVKIDLRNTDITRLKQSISDLEKFNIFDIKKLEKLMLLDKTLYSKLSELDKTKQKLDAFSKTFVEKHDLSKKLSAIVSNIEPEISKLAKLNSKLDILGSVNTKIDTAKSTLKTSEKTISTLKVKVSELGTILERQKTLLEHFRTVQDKLDSINTLEAKIKALKDKINASQKRREKVELELKEFKVCPLCDSPLLDNEHTH